MKFVLTCDCGSTDFRYMYYEEDLDGGDQFKCRECGEIVPAYEAGEHLLGDCDDF